MSEISGLPSAVGIEAVEVLPSLGGGRTVRVSGRWPRRRPEWRGRAVLVIGEGTGRRHIPAMPEPPSLAGVMPGTWRMTFAIPADHVGALEGPVWLGLGTLMTPLTLPPAETDAPHRGADPELLITREMRTLEATVRVARRAQIEAEARAGTLEAEVEGLRAQLDAAAREPERLAAVIVERNRLLRLVEQRAFAEGAERARLEERAAELGREVELREERLHDREARIRELERDLRRARRDADEARQGLDAERSVPPPAPTAPAPAPRRRQARVLSVEAALLAAAVRPHAPAAARPALPVAVTAQPLHAERALIAHTRRLREPTGAQAGAEVVSALAGVTAERDRLDAELAAALGHISRLDAELTRERAAAAERISALQSEVLRQREHSLRALETVAAFRRELLAPVHAPEAPAPTEGDADPGREAPEPPAPVQAERLGAALERLRERAAPEPGSAPDPAPAPAPVRIAAGAGAASTDAVPRLFRELAREEPASAGRLLLGLLPAQHLAYPRPIAYDLVLPAGTCVRVTATGAATTVAPGDQARSADEVQFAATGSPAALARLLAAGPLRRRLGRGIARVRGERHGLAALDALVHAALPLRSLVEVEAQLDPSLVLGLVARALDPALTRAERFSLAHRAAPDAPVSATLHVDDLARPVVTELPLEAAADCTVVCPPSRLLAALLDPRSAAPHVLGDERPLRLLAEWLARA